MMKRRIWYSLPLIFLMIGGCNAVEYYTRGKALTGSDQVSPGSLVYALPRTSLLVTVVAAKTVFRHGPFYQYSAKYLGITGATGENWEEWSISDIRIEAVEDIDPSKYYVIESNAPLEISALALTRSGLILTPNPAIYADQPVIRSVVQEKPEWIFYTDLSVKRNLEMVEDTNYRFIATDSGFVRVPYLYEREDRKTLEEKAEEAANFIIKIRKRRFKLMSGQYETFPEGIALEYAVKELTILEQEYLALFTGKSYIDHYQATYTFTPGEIWPDRPHVLFRFSEKSGLLPADDLTGRPVWLEMSKPGETAIVNDLTYSQAGEKEVDHKALFYRIPETALLRLMDDKTLLAEKKVLVYQFGKTVRMPVNFILK